MADAEKKAAEEKARLEKEAADKADAEKKAAEERNTGGRRMSAQKIWERANADMLSRMQHGIKK